MESMLMLRSASRWATSVKLRAVTGCPITTTTCVAESLAASPSSTPMATSTDMSTVAIACSTASCSSSGSPWVETSTPSTSRPRITTCSTSTMSTPCRLRTANSTEVTPGLSFPVTVISTVVEVFTTDAIPFCPGTRCKSPGGTRHRGSSSSSPTLAQTCRAGLALRSLLRVAGLLDLVGLPLHRGNGSLLVLAAGVGFLAQPLHQVRVVQLEGRALGADPRQLGEVVPRRRAGGGPLQRVAEAPRVVLGDDFPVPVALEHVVQEREHRDAEDERANGGHHVQRGEPVGRQAVGVAARHARVAQPVLHQERGV